MIIEMCCSSMVKDYQVLEKLPSSLPQVFINIMVCSYLDLKVTLEPCHEKRDPILAF